MGMIRTLSYGMGKGLHKVFQDVINELNNTLLTLVESRSEVSHLIPELRNFSEVTRLSAEIKKTSLKENFKEMNNVINNQNILMDDL